MLTVTWAIKNGKNISEKIVRMKKTCPDLPTDTLGTIELTQEAIELLKKGETEEAKAKFAQAREWDANVVYGDEGLFESD